MRMSRNATSGASARISASRLGPVVRHAGDHELGPQDCEALRQERGEPRLVVGDDRRRTPRGSHSVPCRLQAHHAPDGSSTDTHAPEGALSSMMQACARAVHRRQPRAQVGEPEAVRVVPARRRESRARCRAPSSRTPSGSRRADDLDAAALDLRLEPVLDRVLDDRLQHHRRHRQAEQVLGDVDAPREAAAHAQLQDVEIGAQPAQLVGERALVRRRGGRGPQELDQALAACGLAVGGSWSISEIDVSERVVQEMRLDLRFEQLEARRGRGALRRRDARLLAAPWPPRRAPRARAAGRSSGGSH